MSLLHTQCDSLGWKQKQDWNRLYRCATVHSAGKDIHLSLHCLLRFVEHVAPWFGHHTRSLTHRVRLIPIDQRWFSLYWLSRPQFPVQSPGKWMPFYFTLPRRHNMMCNTKAMSLQLFNELLKNSFEIAAKKRSHQLTLFIALLILVIVSCHFFLSLSVSQIETVSERASSLIFCLEISEFLPGWPHIPALVILWDHIARLANQTGGFRLMYYWPGPGEKSSHQRACRWFAPQPLPCS